MIFWWNRISGTIQETILANQTIYGPNQSAVLTVTAGFSEPTLSGPSRSATLSATNNQNSQVLSGPKQSAVLMEQS